MVMTHFMDETSYSDDNTLENAFINLIKKIN